MAEGGARGPGPVLGQSEVVMEAVLEAACLRPEDFNAAGIAANDDMPNSQWERRGLTRGAFRFGCAFRLRCSFAVAARSAGRLIAATDGVAAVRLASSSLRVSLQFGKAGAAREARAMSKAAFASSRRPTSPSSTARPLRKS